MVQFGLLWAIQIQISQNFYDILYGAVLVPSSHHNDTTTIPQQHNHNHIKQRHHKGATNTTTTPQPYHNHTTTKLVDIIVVGVSKLYSLWSYFFAVI